jgi:HK97 family phage major capsid protein
MSDETKVVTVEQAVKAAGDALNGIQHLTDKVEKLGKAYESVKDKVDPAELKKVSDAVEKAAEMAEAMKGQQAALAKKQEALETAMNRAPAGDVLTIDEKGKRLAVKTRKAFNAFAKAQNPNKQYFDEHMKGVLAEDAEFKALSVDSDPDGGYAVVPQFGGKIETFIYESSPMRQLASVDTIGTDQLELLTDNDEADAGWVGEHQSRDDTDTPQLGKIIINVHEIYAQPKATQKLLDDATFDMEAWLSRKVSDVFARKEATAFISGDGVLRPRGITTYAAGTNPNANQIEQVVSKDAAGFTYEGLVNLQTSLKEEYQSNATYLVKRASIANLMLILDGNSRPIFNAGFDKNVGLETMLMGRPLRFGNDVAAIDVNALAAIYGDIRRAYQIVDRQGIRVLRDPFTGKPYVKFYTTKRVGGGVINFEAVKLQKIAAA